VRYIHIVLRQSDRCLCPFDTAMNSNGLLGLVHNWGDKIDFDSVDCVEVDRIDHAVDFA